MGNHFRASESLGRLAFLVNLVVIEAEYGQNFPERDHQRPHRDLAMAGQEMQLSWLGFLIFEWLQI